MKPLETLRCKRYKLWLIERQGSVKTTITESNDINIKALRNVDFSRLFLLGETSLDHQVI